MTNRQLIISGLVAAAAVAAYFIFIRDPDEGADAISDGPILGDRPYAPPLVKKAAPKKIGKPKVPAKDTVPYTWDPRLGVPGWQTDRGFGGGGYGG